MGIPPGYYIEKIYGQDPYQYLVYCGWTHNEQGYYTNESWINFLKETTGYNGYEYGGPWHHNITTNKIYFKEKYYLFFMLKYGHMFGKRPWEV